MRHEHHTLTLNADRLVALATRVGGSESPMGMMSLVKTILKEDGPTGLYRGLGPNFLKVVPAVSISYVVYERLKTFLGVTSI